MLVFDNRGAGESDKPVMRYSTSEMARDLLEVLDHLGWTAYRQLHISGGSSMYLPIPLFLNPFTQTTYDYPILSMYSGH